MPSDDLVRGAFLILALMVASFGAYAIENWLHPRFSVWDLPIFTKKGFITLLVVAVGIWLVVSLCGLLFAL